MRLTKLEMETIIIFNSLEKTAEVYTADPVMMRKMDKLCSESNEVKLVNVDEEWSKTYQVPKAWVKVQKKRTRILTEEQKQANIERFRKLNEAREAKKSEV